MVDILRLGANSLLSLQQAISTTGHNIANVNTEGYSRQTVNFGTTGAQEFGFGFIGQGSRIEEVERAYNSFLTNQVQEFSSSRSRYDIYLGLTARVDDSLANSQHNLSASIQKFFSAVSEVAASPSTLPERQVLLGEANNVVATHQSLVGILEDLNGEVNSSLRLAVTEVNGFADSISALNQQIISAVGGGNIPNDLLDQRDLLVQELAEKVAVQTIEQDDGALNVFIGKGQALVVGAQTTHLAVGSNAYDARQLEIGIEGQPTSYFNSRFITGGELQGLLDFRSRVLQPAQSQLGLVSLGLSETVNQQHQLGLDLNGDIGEALFVQPSVTVAGRITNAGTTVPAVTIDDVTQVRASDYQLSYDGAQWHLIRLSDDTSVSGAGPLVLDGMSVDVSSGAPVSGDSYLFNPARSSAENFALRLSDPSKIAAALPIGIETDLANAGSGSIAEIQIDPVNTLPLAASVTLTFNPDAMGPGIPGFDVAGVAGGPIAYDPTTESAGKTVALGATGVNFEISGIPQAGDSFSLTGNNGATGDNRNMLQLGDLQSQALLNGGTDTYQDLYGAMVAQVGVQHRQGESNLNLETSLLRQAQDYKDSVAGVNLDEEAANLLRYQQAYQASAELIRVSDELFQTLINSF